MPRGDGHTWTFCLLSLCLCPLKSPMQLQEPAQELPQAEPTHLPGAATQNWEQGSCKPSLWLANPQDLWLGHLLLKHLCWVGCGTAPTPSTTRADSSPSISDHAVLASKAVPWWSQDGAQPSSPGKGRRTGDWEWGEPKGCSDPMKKFLQTPKSKGSSPCQIIQRDSSGRDDRHWYWKLLHNKRLRLQEEQALTQQGAWA